MKPATVHVLPATVQKFTCHQCLRHLHARLSHPIPQPTPFVPDTKTFLTLIGRNLLKQEGKIPSWEALFSLSSRQLKESGVEPARARRYLLWWRDRFRSGVFGVGGDLQNVTDGVAELRVAQASDDKGGMQPVVVNPPLSAAMLQKANKSSDDSEAAAAMTTSDNASTVETAALIGQPSEIKPFNGIRYVGDADKERVSCRGIEYVKGDPQVGLLRVQEGLWEQKRGIKVDGGERRRAEVRAKRRAAERRAAR